MRLVPLCGTGEGASTSSSQRKAPIAGSSVPSTSSSVPGAGSSVPQRWFKRPRLNHTCTH